MKKIFYLFTLLAFFGLVFSSCKDKDKTEPTGAIKASVSPAGSATNMRVTQGSTTLEITPDGSGVFQANNLKAGDYAVTFSPAMGFQAPAARNATVSAGNTTDMGTVTLTQPGSQFLGSMSANVNGTAWNSILHSASVNSTDLTITGSSANISGGTSATAEAIALTISNVTGTGTYNSPNAKANFTQGSLAGGSQSSWSTIIPIGSCSVTITKFDQANKKISGTFSFTANPVPLTTASGIKTISNGSFTNINLP